IALPEELEQTRVRVGGQAAPACT
ncbi:MAG: hypothetical protein JWN48_365, partial [Myxococcaceae bacterium]|nr:hypothetical protein [Myxococcaceae bacterium]